MKTDFPNSPQALRIYHEQYNCNANVGMFQDDIYLSIMPIGGKSKNFADFSVKFIGNDSENQHAKKICESITKDEFSYDESNLICKCVDTLSKYLTWNGQLFYEIIYDKNDKQIRLTEVTTENIYKMPFGFLQIIFKNEQNYKKRFNFLKSKNLWKIEMPLILGGKQGYRNILLNLKKYDSWGPKFYINNLGKEALPNSFNFQEYRKICNIYTTQNTLNWKWNQRNIDRDDKTEFYMFYQDISFMWAQAILRNHIIKELNILFTKLNIKSKVVVTGIPTPKEILLFREAFIKGEKNFDDVLKYIFY